MELNKRAEKYIKNLARCVSGYNLPYQKNKSMISAYELIHSKDMTRDEEKFLLEKTMLAIKTLLKELNVDYKNYSQGNYKNIFDWYQKEFDI